MHCLKSKYGLLERTPYALSNKPPAVSSHDVCEENLCPKQKIVPNWEYRPKLGLWFPILWFSGLDACRAEALFGLIPLSAITARCRSTVPVYMCRALVYWRHVSTKAVVLSHLEVVRYLTPFVLWAYKFRAYVSHSLALESVCINFIKHEHPAITLKDWCALSNPKFLLAVAVHI